MRLEGESNVVNTSGLIDFQWRSFGTITNCTPQRKISGCLKLAAVWLAMLLGQSLVRADTHTLPLPEWESPWWSVYAVVEGQDVKFIDEGDTGVEGHVILYTALKQATVSVYADFHGDLPPNVEPISLTLEIYDSINPWTVEGGVASSVIDLTVNKERMTELRILAGRAVLYTSDPSYTPSAHFSAVLYVARPISVGGGSASGGSMAIYVYSHTPCLQTNLAGEKRVDYKLDPLADASVKVEAIDGVGVGSGWLTTDSSGRAMATVWADTSSVVGQGGYVHGKVRIKAVKDRATVEREIDIRIPYALVAAVNGATLVSRAGAIIEPNRIIPGDVLLPGDVVQVGNEFIWSGAYITLWFCNGQRVTLQSDTVTGIRAVVGQGSFDHRTPVLQATLQNTVEQIRSDPRRYGRMLIYKTLGNMVDKFLGVPDPVGWVVTTPGGAVEEWLTEFGEAAYQPKNRGTTQRSPMLAGAGPLAPDASWVGSIVDFYSDGTVRLYNRGATATLRGPSGSRTIPLGGMTVARLDKQGGELAAVGAAPLTGAAPLIELVPTEGAIEVPVRPELRLWLSEQGGNLVLPGSIIGRLDGYLLPSPRSEENQVVFHLPPGTALSPGLHRWDIEFALVGGGVVRTSATFQVTAVLPAPQSVRAASGSNKVALRWDPEALEWARGGFRVYRTVAGGTPTLISGEKPLRQPNFVDNAPVPGAMYQVTGLDDSGREGTWSAPVPAAFPGGTPPSPQQVTVTAQSIATGYGLALQIDDPTAGFTLWRIEAGPTANGPFTDMLNGELTSVNPWPIPRPFEETRRWFRVTAVNVDGQAGPSTVVGPLSLPTPLPPVTGLTASPNPDGSVLLMWDPWTAQQPVAYKVERWVGNAWVTAAEIDATSLSWVDVPSSNADLRQWRVRARLSNGSESPASATIALRLQPIPSTPGIVRFANGSLKGVEGEKVAVRVVREGSVELPAFVTWSTWGWAGSALPDYDYVADAGLLVLAPGETEKSIEVQLLADTQREQEELFYVYLRGVEGGPVLGEPSVLQVAISEGPVLAWESSWFYVSEDGPSEVEINVVLSGPAPYPVQVDYEFVSDRSTATPGEDFVGPLSGTLTFAPGQTKAGFTIAVINDAIKEGTQPENALFRLFNPRNAPIDDTDPFRLYATVQIADDDTQPGYAVFAQNTLRIREGESSTLTIRREGGSDDQLQLFLFPIGGNATEGEDWTLAPSFPQFQDGQTEINVTLSALRDGRAEGAELLVLGMHGGFGPGQMSTLLVTIEDADGAVSGFAAWANQQLINYPQTARAAAADPDNDGLPNWVEYLWCTDPTKPDRPSAPEQSFNEWGEWQVRVTIREDTAGLVVAEFAGDVLWRNPMFDAGTWQSNGDGTRTGLFRFYGFGLNSGFVRFRSEWTGEQ